jgi:hypothetical protein
MKAQFPQIPGITRNPINHKEQAATTNGLSQKQGAWWRWPNVIRRSAQSLRTESSRGCINKSSLDFAFIGHGAQRSFRL